MEIKGILTTEQEAQGYKIIESDDHTIILQQVTIRTIARFNHNASPDLIKQAILENSLPF